MTSDYALEELGPRAFEQLSVALASSIVGPGLEIYGSGSDGDEKRHSMGPIRWSATDGGGRWDGYTVIKPNSANTWRPADNLNWLKIQIRQRVC